MVKMYLCFAYVIFEIQNMHVCLLLNKNLIESFIKILPFLFQVKLYSSKL